MTLILQLSNMDNKLNFEEHVFDLCKKASKQLNVVRRLQKFICKGQKRQLETPLFHCFSYKLHLLPLDLACLFILVITKKQKRYSFDGEELIIMIILVTIKHFQN